LGRVDPSLPCSVGLLPSAWEFINATLAVVAAPALMNALRVNACFITQTSAFARFPISLVFGSPRLARMLHECL